MSSSIVLHLILLGQGLSLNMELTDSARPVGLSFIYTSLVVVHTAMPGLFYVVMGDQVLMLT